MLASLNSSCCCLPGLTVLPLFLRQQSTRMTITDNKERGMMTAATIFRLLADWHSCTFPLQAHPDPHAWHTPFTK